MSQALRLLVLAFAFLLVQPGDRAIAQSIKQIKLTDKHVEGFIAAQKEMSAVTMRTQGSTSDKPDPKIQAELENIARKHGFKDFNEYDDIAANIAAIMAGIDPSTKVFTEAPAAIKKEIEEVMGDKSLSDTEKKKMIEELNEALKSAEPIKYPENIELIKRYFERIESALQ